MTRQGPNFHDDPRIETGSIASTNEPLSEKQIEINQRGIALVRRVQQLKNKEYIEKMCINPAVARLIRLVDNSEPTSDGRTTAIFNSWVQTEVDAGRIDHDEQSFVLGYFNQAIYENESRPTNVREPDLRERQANQN